MTKPPYEWPTRMTGPFVRCARNEATYGASVVTPRRRFGGGEDGEALGLQHGRDAVPAGAVGPGSVYQRDRGLRHFGPLARAIRYPVAAGLRRTRYSTV